MSIICLATQKKMRHLSEKEFKDVSGDESRCPGCCTRPSSSILYSWSVASDSSKVSFFGITKHFQVDNGTVNLMYKTTNKEIYDADKNTWIEALKAAHMQ